MTGGGDELIGAISTTDSVSLLIVGSGGNVGLLREKAANMGLIGKIKFIPVLPWESLMKYTRSADAGLSLDKNSNLNYNFSLPNKLFDYISAGIPVIASELPEISKILGDYNCGLSIPEVNPREISKAIMTLRDNRGLLLELKRNAGIASESLNWETESQKVKELYGPIINNL